MGPGDNAQQVSRPGVQRGVGRLAPTPSGHLHLGNALAFGAAYLSARAAGARLVYRLEDLDQGRARAAFVASLEEDLGWLGIDWDETLAPQRARSYDLAAFPTYRCCCNRARRLNGLCDCRARASAPSPSGASCLRLISRGEPQRFVDRARGDCAFRSEGDPVLLRADGQVAYMAAVVLDDLRDGVTEVVRGVDLLEATATQQELYQHLGRAPPSMLHAPLLVDEEGRKLSKRHGSLSIRALRGSGVTPEGIWAALLPLLGYEASSPPTRLQQAAPFFRTERIPSGPFCMIEAQGQLILKEVKP